MILEKTCNAESQDNWPVLSSRGSLANSVTKGEHSIELVQFTSAMHVEMIEEERKVIHLEKTAPRDDIVMMIDGETFCVPRRTCQRSLRRKMIRCSLLSNYTKTCRGNSN